MGGLRGWGTPVQVKACRVHAGEACGVGVEVRRGGEHPVQGGVALGIRQQLQSHRCLTLPLGPGEERQSQLKTNKQRK